MGPPRPRPVPRSRTPLWPSTGFMFLRVNTKDTWTLKGRGLDLNWYLRVQELKAETTERGGTDIGVLGVPSARAGVVRGAVPSKNPGSLRVSSEVPGRGGQIELITVQNALVRYCERSPGQLGVPCPGN